MGQVLEIEDKRDVDLEELCTCRVEKGDGRDRLVLALLADFSDLLLLDLMQMTTS